MNVIGVSERFEVIRRGRVGRSGLCRLVWVYEGGSVNQYLRLCFFLDAWSIQSLDSSRVLQVAESGTV